jgi:hypothetical protein
MQSPRGFESVQSYRGGALAQTVTCRPNSKKAAEAAFAIPERFASI